MTQVKSLLRTGVCEIVYKRCRFTATQGWQVLVTGVIKECSVSTTLLHCVHHFFRLLHGYICQATLMVGKEGESYFWPSHEGVPMTDPLPHPPNQPLLQLFVLCQEWGIFVSRIQICCMDSCVLAPHYNPVSIAAVHTCPEVQIFHFLPQTKQGWTCFATKHLEASMQTVLLLRAQSLVLSWILFAHTPTRTSENTLTLLGPS